MRQSLRCLAARTALPPACIPRSRHLSQCGHTCLRPTLLSGALVIISVFPFLKEPLSAGVPWPWQMTCSKATHLVHCTEKESSLLKYLLHPGWRELSPGKFSIPAHECCTGASYWEQPTEVTKGGPAAIKARIRISCSPYLCFCFPEMGHCFYSVLLAGHCHSQRRMGENGLAVFKNIPKVGFGWDEMWQADGWLMSLVPVQRFK